MNLPKITICYAVYMMVVGVLGYLVVGAGTALIPLGLGLLLLIAGGLAAKDIMRMHMMHAAAMISVIAVIAGGYRLYLQVQFLIQKGELSNTVAFAFIALMVVGSLVFAVLCVKSFIEARLLKKE